MPREPLPPARLGPYRLLARLGRGGMADVHLGRRYGAAGFEKDVAIKVLRPEHREDPERLRLFLAEARLGARFDHPGLVQVHDLGLDGDLYYMVMDRVDGLDLAALIARRPLPRPLALHVGEEVALALAHVHGLADDAGRPLGVVHRDLSPANLLIARSGAVKLIDFGIAKATAQGDVTWGRLRKGKFAYMAPEQVLGAVVSDASDRFALAVVLCELLLGRRPFDGDDPLTTMQAIRDAAPPPPAFFADLSPALVDLLRRCLSREPSHRLADSAALARALRRIRVDEGHHAGPLDLAAWLRLAVEGGAPDPAPAPPTETAWQTSTGV